MERPNTSEIISKVRQIEIKTNRPVEGIISGAYLSAFKGTGIEFSEVREYQLVPLLGILIYSKFRNNVKPVKLESVIIQIDPKKNSLLRLQMPLDPILREQRD